MRVKRKNDFVFDVKEMMIENIKESKAIKYTSILMAVSVGLMGVGYGAKILNFSISNIKALVKTIKRK